MNNYFNFVVSDKNSDNKILFFKIKIILNTYINKENKNTDKRLRNI